MADWLISWIPLYYPLKLAFIIWLQLPSTKGASKIYHAFIQPNLKRHEGRVDDALVQAQRCGPLCLAARLSAGMSLPQGGGEAARKRMLLRVWSLAPLPQPRRRGGVAVERGNTPQLGNPHRVPRARQPPPAACRGSSSLGGGASSLLRIAHPPRTQRPLLTRIACVHSFASQSVQDIRTRGVAAWGTDVIRRVQSRGGSGSMPGSSTGGDIAPDNSSHVA